MKIGIFDSGLGGLGLYKDILEFLPSAQYFYIADHAFCPYGDKTNAQIIERSEQIASKLINQHKVDLVVVACNTATATAIDHLRKKFQTPFVGIEPYVKVIERFQKEEKNSFKLVILLTPLSAKSQRFHKLKTTYDPKDQIAVYPCPHLANLVEEHIHEHESDFFKNKLEEELSPLKNQGFTHAILGCTHYPHIADQIESILGLKTISPDRAVAQRVYNIAKQYFFPLEEAQVVPTVLPLHFESTAPTPSLKARLDQIINTPYLLEEF